MEAPGTNAESVAAEANTTHTLKPPQKKWQGLCDVVEQFNEQIKQMQEYMQSSCSLAP